MGSASPTSRWRRRSFFAGIAIAFIVQLALVNHFFYTGEALVRVKLWQFYLFEIQRAINGSRAVGPTTGSGFQALVILATHAFYSSFGGLLALGVTAIVRRVRS